MGLLAALDDDSARRLLRAAAGLELRPGGAVFVRGDVGPFGPYLPERPPL